MVSECSLVIPLWRAGSGYLHYVVLSGIYLRPQLPGAMGALLYSLCDVDNVVGSIFPCYQLQPTTSFYILSRIYIMELIDMHLINSVDIELNGNIEEWTELCPHGNVVRHERDNTPGFRCHDVWTDCPWCNRMVRYRDFIWQFRRCSEGNFSHCPDSFDIIYDTAIKNGEHKPSRDMWRRMEHDLDYVKWFAYHGILNGTWDDECHRMWCAWLSRRFF